MECVFFYGTLMAGFDRRRRAAMDGKLSFVGRGWIRASLFDLGLYPAAVPSPDGCVWGELYELSDSETVLPALDEIEGYTPRDIDHSLYVRSQVNVMLPDALPHVAWVYFYNAPLGQAQRIESGDYLQHVRVR
ncbi:MAG: gamma-glutamylcyclotransferase [Vicinamibacterales bacterium]